MWRFLIPSLSRDDKLILRQAQDEELWRFLIPSLSRDDKLILRQAHPSTSSSFGKLRMRVFLSSLTLSPSKGEGRTQRHRTTKLYVTFATSAGSHQFVP